MARPFPTTFDKDSPMTPQSATSNISYQTNVNRQKTKKWAEARTVNYGGDDWGEDDEYGYETPPAPVPKSTGLRQPGQVAQSSSNISSPFTDSSKKYGNLPPLPGPSGGRGRANSFDAGDEKRNFSNATFRQPSPPRAQGPATRFSQITGVPTIRNPAGPPALHISTEQPTQPQPAPPRQINRATTPVTGSPHPEVLTAGAPGRANMGESGSVMSPVSDLVTPSTASDYHARRDYSPSAVPPPLSTRASPGPQSAVEIASTAKFPARKSSLSQSMGSPVGQIMQTHAELSAPKQYIAGQESSPENSSRSPTTPTDKALPFIRPADIYRRRMEEEQERQSMESSRPSMDSIMETRSKAGSDPLGTTQLRKESSSESLGAAYRLGLGTQGEEPLDSGQRLMPVLEPVKERKSEYGFDGIDVNEPTLNTLGQSTNVSQEPSMDRLGVEEVRRQSTSPKLPDLNRISGFGMDLFSSSDSPLHTGSEITPTTASTSHDPSANDEDLSLRTQPSIGFRSVVNQAFDTSVPPTPASRSGSGVRRTDSESTGTTGVSPIMSRVPSSVVSGSRVPDSTTPSIPEVVNEPTSPEVEDEMTYNSRDGREVPGLKLGHRRDISTPSPGNSPARTPDLNTASHIITASQHADVSLASPEVLSPSDDEPLQAPRPLADRENSFRPNLPGGWTSYATTARSETPTGLVEDNQTPINSSLHTENPGEDFDLTPTTIKQTLPQTEFGTAVTGTAVIGSTGAAWSRHEKAGPIDTSLSNSPKQMPNPDLTIASGGNIYSTNTLDSKVPPNLEQAPNEIQLRPDAVGKVTSDESSAAPTPPPKDTPVMSSIENGAFSSHKAPLQQEFHQAEPWQNHESSLTPEDLPTSPDTHSYDEENDKLQKEIVESLTPQPSTAIRQDEHSLSDQAENISSRGQGRESTYLPQEYDNYWASTADDGKELPAISEAAQPAVQAPIIAPLSPRRDEQASLVPPRPALQSRFSWEGETENAVAGPPSPADHDSSSFAPEVDSPAIAALPGATELEAPNSLSERQVLPNEEISSTAVVSSTLDHLAEDSTAPYTSVNPIGSGAGVLAGAVAVGGIYEHAHDRPGQSNRRLSLAEEKGFMVSSYPVSPTPPEDEHPARSPKPYLPLSTDHNLDPRAPITVSPVDTPVQQQFSPTAGRPIAFKDIVAINSPKQRIQVFNETRQHWATIDTGLSDWMVRLQGQYPEHAGTTGAWSGSRTSAPIGSARSKFSKPAGPAPPLQQPYYQQYLNASSPANPSTPINPGPGPGPSFQTNAQHNFAPAGNKLTSHQVQAKGKEFLHTAGIFGGKAGKAGKGLLAKGKNKFRGSGGDKSPPPKPKSEHRSSWGLPLNMTRSSNRHDGSSRHSKDSTPTPTIQGSRAATTTSSEAVPSLENPISDDLGGRASGARVSEDISRQLTPVTTTMIRQVTQEQHPEPSRQLQDDDAVSDLDDRDALAIPTPTSKSQPSGNAFNAASITEEAVQDEIPPKERHVSLESQKTVSSLSVPIDLFSKSERSNSDDAHFYDASEEPSDINNDWVMVSPNQESKEALSHDDPVIVIRDEQQVELELPKPVVSPTTSIINRPRGSSYEVPSPPISAKSQTITAASPPASSFAPSKMTESFISPAPQISPLEDNVSSLPANLPQTEADKSSSTTSFLPPIRRTSTFGLGFGSRKAKHRFAIEDEDNETTSPDVQPTLVVPVTIQNVMSSQSARPEEHHLPTTEEIHNIPSAEHQELQQASPPRSLPHSQPTTETPLVQNQPFPSGNVYSQANQKSIEQSSSSRAVAARQSQGPMWANRPPLTQGGSSSVGQRNLPVLRDSPQPPISPPRAADVLQRPEFRESQVEWRPNRPKATPAPALPITSSDWKEMDLPPPRNSWDPQSEREISAPPQINNPGEEEEYDEKPSRTVPIVQQRPYEQPPSSAQRYPELFRPGQTGTDVPRGSIDLPAQYYQAPIPRGAAFLPRQQTNEYQLPGVGPPEPPRSSGTRRSSGFLRDIVSRTSSRERRSNSISRDHTLSRGNEYADSIAPSDGAQDRQRKRSSFFGALYHGSTSGLGTPASHESVIAHNSTSTTDLVVTPPSQPSPVLRQERKKSLFSGSHLADPRSKPKKLERASTSTTGTNESSKKNRFSGLGGLFSKSSQSTKATVEPRPQATRELSQHERQPLESPLLIPAKSNKPPAAISQTRSPSQSRNVLSKLTHSNTSNSSPLKESKQRRSSASGLLNGFMGRKTNGTERGSDDSRSQGSASQLGQQPVLLSQTYTDLQQQEQALVTPPTQVQHPAKSRPSAQGIPVDNRAVSTPERGRRINREPAPYVEPQYDSVPIPSGYSLVRGDGSLLVESAYDPRGLGRPQYAPSPIRGTYSNNIIPNQPQTLAYGSGQQHFASRSQQSYPAVVQQNRQPNQQKPILNALETYQSYTSHATRLSREDLLARSPPKSIEGQQRPYQISLPGGDDDEDERPVILQKDPVAQSSHAPTIKQSKNDPIQRLQQPTLRHPASPAGYPLPDDTVFSPVNPGVNDIPPPPPPKWPSHLDYQHKMGHERQQSLTQSLSTMDIDLDRSNTRRTAVSAVSGFSGPPMQSGLNVPGKDFDVGRSDSGHGGGRALNMSSPSPSPPSPMRTPQRGVSPEGNTVSDDIRTTEVRLPSGHEEDLYNASPRLPKPVPTNGNGNTDHYHQNGTASSVPLSDGKENQKVKGIATQFPKTYFDPRVPEEKIPTYTQNQLSTQEDEPIATMSATSYPGQEWNPYAGAGWDEADD